MGEKTSIYVSKSLYGIASFHARYTLALILCLSDERCWSKVKTYLSECGIDLGLEELISQTMDLLDELSKYIAKCKAKLRIDFNEKVLDITSQKMFSELYEEESLEAALRKSTSKSYRLLYHIVNSIIEYYSSDYMKHTEGALLINLLNKSPEYIYKERIPLIPREYSTGTSEESSFEHLANKLMKAVDKIYELTNCLLAEGTARRLLYDIALLTNWRFRFVPSDYYAVVFIDSDEASKLFMGIDSGLFTSYSLPLKALITALDSYYINQVDVSGMPFYIAGDDYLWIIPIEDLIPSLLNFGQALENLGLKFSVSIVIPHVRIPLRIVTNYAQSNMTNIAKKFTLRNYHVKNTLVITKLTSSKITRNWVIPFPLIEFRRVLTAFMNFINLFIKLRHIYKLRDGESMLMRLRNIINAYTIEEKEAVTSELFRLENILHMHEHPELVNLLECLGNVKFEINGGQRSMLIEFLGILNDVLPELRNVITHYRGV